MKKKIEKSQLLFLENIKYQLNIDLIDAAYFIRRIWIGIDLELSQNQINEIARYLHKYKKGEIVSNGYKRHAIILKKES